MDTWGLVEAERQQIADKLAALPEEAWDEATLCADWRVGEVVGHMTAVGTTSPVRWLGAMARNRFRFHQLVAEEMRSNTEERSPAEILVGFKATVSSHGKPPGPKATVLGEILVHGEDIFRALEGRFSDHAIEAVVAVADHYKRNTFPLGVRTRIKGVTLRMTDADWSYGSGPEVTGPGIAVVMAMAGRKIALADLKGDGVGVLSSRQ
jgi:uncharacterized protein (TIGR03083 family)